MPDVRMHSVMNDIVSSDGEYPAILRKSDTYSGELDRMDLSKEIRLLIDRYVSEQNAHSRIQERPLRVIEYSEEDFLRHRVYLTSGERQTPSMLRPFFIPAAMVPYFEFRNYLFERTAASGWF